MCVCSSSIRRSSRHVERPRTVPAGPFACECLASMAASMAPQLQEVMADLTELKLTKSERDVDPIFESLHHIQRDHMAYMRLEKIKRLMESQGPRTPQHDGNPN